MAESMSDDVRNFVERDKALCSQALDHGRDVLLRAAEMVRAAERSAKAPGHDLT